MRLHSLKAHNVEPNQRAKRDIGRRLERIVSTVFHRYHAPLSIGPDSFT